MMKKLGSDALVIIVDGLYFTGDDVGGGVPGRSESLDGALLFSSVDTGGGSEFDLTVSFLMFRGYKVELARVVPSAFELVPEE